MVIAVAGIRNGDPARTGSLGRTPGRRGSQRIISLSRDDGFLGAGSRTLDRCNRRAREAGQDASVRAADAPQVRHYLFFR